MSPNLLPDDAIVGGLEPCLPGENANLNARGVGRGGDVHLDIGGEQVRGKGGLDEDLVLHARLADFVDDGVDTEREVDVLGGAVLHQLKLTVGGHEGDCAVVVKATQLHALVELTVIELNSRLGPNHQKKNR